MHQNGVVKKGQMHQVETGKVVGLQKCNFGKKYKNLSAEFLGISQTHKMPEECRRHVLGFVFGAATESGKGPNEDAIVSALYARLWIAVHRKSL